MNVLVIGSGGREHALAWALANSNGVGKVWVAPGNAGTAVEPGLVNVDIDVMDFDALIDLVKRKDIGFTVVGPEAPLVAGAVDRFRAEGMPCFGPDQGAAQLEGSKSFTKDFLARHNIPTAAYETFTDLEAAKTYVRRQGAPIVVKADGLAAGKGVVVARTEDEAIAALEDMLSANAFGEAGHRVVVEEFMEGEEASFICVCDGTHAIPFATSQDHKARDNGDKGPNTGGMGAYSPAPVVTSEVHARVMAQVIEPTMRGMAEMGHPYVGFLYAGLMINAAGEPRVVEFNCRFGDPEAQPVLMRLRSDLLDICQRAVNGNLGGVQLAFADDVALGVVMAAGGYPLDYTKGDVISGVAAANATGCKVFHAGSALKDGHAVTAGGRVLCVVGLGDSVSAAQAAAYAGVSEISWSNAYCRTDIGYRAVARENA